MLASLRRISNCFFGRSSRSSIGPERHDTSQKTSLVFRQQSLQDGDVFWVLQGNTSDCSVDPELPGRTLKFSARKKLAEEHGSGRYAMCPEQWFQGIDFLRDWTANDMATRIIDQALEDGKVASVHIFSQPLICNLDDAIQHRSDTVRRRLEDMRESGFTHIAVDQDTRTGFAFLKKGRLEEVWAADGAVLWMKDGEPATHTVLPEKSAFKVSTLNY